MKFVCILFFIYFIALVLCKNEPPVSSSYDELVFSQNLVEQIMLEELEEWVENPHECMLVFSYASWNGHAKYFINHNTINEVAEFFKKDESRFPVKV